MSATEHAETERYETPEEMAKALLTVEERDRVKATFVAGGEEKETKQKVVEITEGGTRTIYCEECPGWNGPCVGFEVDEFTNPPRLRNQFTHPFDDPTMVERFVSIEIERADSSEVAA